MIYELSLYILYQYTQISNNFILFHVQNNSLKKKVKDKSKVNKLKPLRKCMKKKHTDKNFNLNLKKNYI